MDENETKQEVEETTVNPVVEPIDPLNPENNEEVTPEGDATPEM